jgi:cyclase
MTIYYGLLKIELHAVDPEWVVPGHGPVGTKKDVQKELKYFATIRDHLRARIAAGPSPGGAAATIDMGDFMEWPDADRYYGKAMRMYRDLTGKTFDQAATSAALDMYQKMTKK